MTRISPNQLGVALGLITFLFVTTAAASHYELEDVRFFSPEEIKTFETLGIEGTDGLLTQLESPKMRKALSQRTGISLERLQELLPPGKMYLIPHLEGVVRDLLVWGGIVMHQILPC